MLALLLLLGGGLLLGSSSSLLLLLLLLSAARAPLAQFDARARGAPPSGAAPPPGRESGRQAHLCVGALRGDAVEGAVAGD